MRLLVTRMSAVAVLSVAAGLLVGASLTVLTPLPAGRILIRSPIVLHPPSPMPAAEPDEVGSPALTIAVADPDSSAPSPAAGRAADPAPALGNPSTLPAIRPAAPPAPTPAVSITAPARTESTLPIDRATADTPKPVTITIAVGVSGRTGGSQTSRGSVIDRNERE